MTEKVSTTQGRRLLRLARETIGRQLGVVDEVSLENLNENVFQVRAGTFVTLKIDDNLRGCIGNLEPHDTIVESIRRNSISSAFHDHRFAPLKKEEFARVRIDISVLTEATPLNYRDGNDLAAKIRPGVDGVILRMGSSQATFLPQVWEQLPDPGSFLGHLCLKAGLQERCWCDGHPDIFVYQVQYFGEEAKMILTLSSHLIEQTAVLYADMEKAYDVVAAEVGLSCTGCPDNCCDSYFLHHTYIEWAYLWHGVEQLTAAEKRAILSRAEQYELESQKFLEKGIRPRLMCPLNENGRCSMYRYRLMVCRTHGVPATMMRPDGKELRFPGCFVCQDLVEKNKSAGKTVMTMERTGLLKRLVGLEQELLEGRRHLVPKVKMTIAGMMVSGPPVAPRGLDKKKASL